jgi:hypothetical protein
MDHRFRRKLRFLRKGTGPTRHQKPPRESIAPLSAKSWPLDLRGLAQRCRSQRISLLGSRDSDALCNSPQDAFHLSSSSLDRSGLFERFGSERTIGSGPESEHHWKVGDTRQLWPHPSRTRFVDLFEPSQAIVHQETLLLRSRLFRHPCGSPKARRQLPIASTENALRIFAVMVATI